MTEKQTILITGATSGIGRDGALALARAGHRVFATGRRVSALEAIQEEAAGTALVALRLDVNDASSIERAHGEVLEATGGYGIDVLINNAGYGQAGPAELISDAGLRAQFDTNVFGLMAMVRTFVPAMRLRGRGRVINVTSIGGRITMPFMGTYSATKYAVESLSDALRVELRHFGVDVVLVEPGPIATNFAATSHNSLRGVGGDRSPYASWLALAEQAQRRSDAASFPVRTVTRAIEKAVTSRRPRARYVAPGMLRPLVWLAELLPGGWTDAFYGVVLRRMHHVGERRLTAAAA